MKNQASVVEALLFAAANNSTNRGPRYANTNNRSTNANANIGFRQNVNTFFQNYNSLAHAKIVNSKTELVSN